VTEPLTYVTSLVYGSENVHRRSKLVLVLQPADAVLGTCLLPAAGSSSLQSRKLAGQALIRLKPFCDPSSVSRCDTSIVQLQLLLEMNFPQSPRTVSAPYGYAYHDERSVRSASAPTGMFMPIASSSGFFGVGPLSHGMHPGAPAEHIFAWASGPSGATAGGGPAGPLTERSFPVSVVIRRVDKPDLKKLVKMLPSRTIRDLVEESLRVAGEVYTGWNANRTAVSVKQEAQINEGCSTWRVQRVAWTQISVLNQNDFEFDWDSTLSDQITPDSIVRVVLTPGDVTVAKIPGSDDCACVIL